jgi:isopentenyl-diphosphate delta-isomerase
LAELRNWPASAFEERVVLVDAQDVGIGSAEKLAAHRSGTLHRAFSVVLFSSAGKMLLQRRAPGKYHSGGLWSNSCCGHPRPGERTVAAAERRLWEELRVRCALRPQSSFVYHADLAFGLREHEYDHILVGNTDADPDPDPAEVMDWMWAEPLTLGRDIISNPSRYTAWLPLVLDALQTRDVRDTGGIRGALDAMGAVSYPVI